MTLEEWRTETECATCHRPLELYHTVRNANGRRVHKHCPPRT